MILIYPKAAYDDVMEACQPVCGFESVGPLLVGTPVESADGRYAHCHGLSEEEEDFLTARISGIAGAEVLAELPADWTPRADE